MFGQWHGNNAMDARVEFQNAKLALVAAGLDPQTIVDAALTQGYLRFEQLLTTGVNQITFPVLNNVGSSAGIRPTEARLALQDAFYAAGFSVFLSKAANATTAAMPLFSWPNPVTFTTGGAAPAPLLTFYNGYLNIQVSGINILPKYPLTDFLDIPATQLTAATNSPLDQFVGSERIALQPNPVFIGQQNPTINVIMPTAVTAVDAFTYVVIIAHGVLAQNVTIVS